MTAVAIILAAAVVVLTLALHRALRPIRDDIRAEEGCMHADRHRLPYETASGTPVHDALARERRSFGLPS